MSRHTYQVVWLVLSLLGLVISSINCFLPTKASEEPGFAGIVGVLIRVGVSFWLLMGAGAYSEIFQ